MFQSLRSVAANVSASLEVWRFLKKISNLWPEQKTDRPKGPTSHFQTEAIDLAAWNDLISCS